ncbi:hypothetical protein EDD22DRAFT_751449, partial [Suillus occidentalis]
MFALCCWIRGTEIHECFTVKISPLETIDTLKVMIKASDTSGMPASALRLYKPHDPVAEPYEANLGRLQLSSHEAPLLPSRQISDLFEEPPPKGHIHIIVDAPKFLIHCWLRGSRGEEGFEVSIRSNASIGALKEHIKAEESKLKHVDQSRITLYRISGAEDDVLESLDTMDAGDVLQITKSL